MTPELERLLEKFPTEGKKWEVRLNGNFRWRVYLDPDETEGDERREDRWFTSFWFRPLDIAYLLEFHLREAENLEEAIEMGWNWVRGMINGLAGMRDELEAATRAEGPRVSAWERL